MVKKIAKKTAKKTVSRKKTIVKKNTKTIILKLTTDQWTCVKKWSGKANLEPPVYVKKILIDFLNIE